MSIKNIFFDLDGTLTDPKQGITKSVQYALEKLDRPIPKSKELLWCIGPPLLISLKKLLADNTILAEKALVYYRERYSQIGKFENQIYNNIPFVLNNLKKMGLSLFVATSKPYVFAKEITDHFDLSIYFKQIYGSELSGELSDKTDLIAHILKRENLDIHDTLMIGDRKYDILGAKKCGIKNLGVTYGYGSKNELLESGADFLVDNPSDISQVVINLNTQQKIAPNG
ncbi:MAG: HAD family hydrolase [Bacteroidetes bacterium]|nr:HAD family hydrolase [Bacteroidota bacterium]